MADKQEVHPVIELMLKRMDSHPEEFRTDHRWAHHYQHQRSHWNSTEKKLFNAKMREIRMQAMHENLMKELLK